MERSTSLTNAQLTHSVRHLLIALCVCVCVCVFAGSPRTFC